MRSKKTRIAVTGSLLGLLAAAALHENAATRPQMPSSKAELATAVPPVSPDQSVMPAAEKNAAASLWSYVNKPAHAARVESVMATPSHDVHYAQIDKSQVGGPDSPLAKPGAKFDLALPDGSVVSVSIQKVKQIGEDRFVSQGVVQDEKHGRAIFAYNHGEMSAVIDDLQHGSWQVRSLGDGTSQVFKVDPAMVPGCDATSDVSAAARRAVQSSAPVAAGDEWSGDTSSVAAPQDSSSYSTWGNTEVRVLVPYSKVIETVMSPWAIQSSIDLGVGELNDDLARSGVPVTVTLAGTPALQYNQEWDSSYGAAYNALTRVANSADGILDEVHTLRTDAQADLVCFAMCQIDPNNSGIGYILNTAGDPFNATYGFSVVNFWYMNSNSTFAHEIGHNLGCNHDRDNARSADGAFAYNTYSYSYGYRFYGNDGQQYRTIMAYPPGNVLPYFSNPNIWAWDPISAPVGAQLGSWDEAYNALTITQNAAEVSNYRYSRLVARIARRIRGY